MTRDIDIVLDLDRSTLERLHEVLEPDYYVPRDASLAAVNRRAMFNLIHQESVIKVDCILAKNEEYRRLELQRRVKVQVSDFTTYVVSKEDQVLSKLVWAKESRSPMQLGDVKNLLATGCDETYLNRWAMRLNVSDLLEECLYG